MSTVYNISAGPHTRDGLTTKRIMWTVVASLMPVTVMGVWYYGFHAFLVLLVSVAAAVVSEYAFCVFCRKPVTVSDGSAVITGLLLALTLAPSVPLYVPLIGAMFAILVAKCCFGGLGKNFINPALAGRCFVLISFSSTVSSYKVDGISSATPMMILRGGRAVSITQMFLGRTNAVIGSCILALLIGGLALWVLGIINGDTVLSVLLSFTVFLVVFGGQGLDIRFLLAHLCGGGVMMGAFFMATDYTTSPVTRPGRILYGVLIGIMGAMFRVFSSVPDAFSYSIIIANLFVPLIDMFIIPKPYGFRKEAVAKQRGETRKKLIERIPVPVIVLTVIALVSGLALSGVFTMTRDIIEEQKLMANSASYQAVLPDAVTFEKDDAMETLLAQVGGDVYGSSFGRTTIAGAVIGKDAAGALAGTAVSVTNADGFDGNISLSVGIDPEGRVTGISFTELNETPGMGMRADEPAFKDQFAGKKVDAFVLNGKTSSDANIDSVSGASTTSGAVVNAVNAALDFYRTAKGGAQ